MKNQFQPTVRPMKKRNAPAYPTINGINQEDLSRAPQRWSRLKSVAASLGTIAMTMKAFAQDATTVAAAPSVQTSERTTTSCATQTKANQTVTDVCPLQPIAVAGEGRGGFGCLAMNPPVMLPECEALEIIDKAFAQRGISLTDCPELEGVSWPSKPDRPTLMIDLGNVEKGIYVDYVSYNDVDQWKDPPGLNGVFSGSSYHEFNLRQVAERACHVLSSRTQGRAVSVGVLYDPVVYVSNEQYKAGDKMKTSEERSAYRKSCREAARNEAREKLIAQLESLFEHLAKRGKLPKNVGPSKRAQQIKCYYRVKSSKIEIIGKAEL